MHQRNLIALAIEMHKNSNDVNELYIPYYTRFTVEVEEDANGDLNYTKKWNLKFSAIKYVTY